MSGKTSGSDAKSSDGAKQRQQHHDGSSTRAFTDEQKAAVVRVRKCSPTAFYDILGIESEKTSVSDAGIKKAYRKLSLLTHPDKNGYAGADEAFKMVSRAFQILSDPDKKKKFDTFGGDPDSRFGSSSASSGAAAGASPFSGFARRPTAGESMFQEEISPEELFRQFFGGGLGGGFGGPFGGGPFGGGAFDGSPGFVFNMGGGPGIRVHQFGGGRPRRRPAGADDDRPTAGQALQNLLPLLILLVIPILSGLFSSSSAPSLPLFSLDTPRPPLTQPRSTALHGHDLTYYVNPRDAEPLSARRWADLDRKAANDLLYQLDSGCQLELQTQERLLADSRGIFGFGFDQAKYDAARRMEKPRCTRLKAYGYNPSRR